MKVLIVSHTVFSDTESMGKTLSSYFRGFKVDELAQFFIHSQIPTSSLCQKYYRMTDKDAILSIFRIKKGEIITSKYSKINDVDNRTDEGIMASIYQKGRKRTPIIYLLRNLCWRLSHWDNNKLRKWIDDFDPDCVFFASGDYSFMYRIALKIAKRKKIPLYISCMDDYYFYNKNEHVLLGRLQHKLFMKSVYKTMDYASKIFCICDKMSADYQKLFDKKCITIHTPATITNPLNSIKKNQICYLGSLGYQRDKQLIEIGRTLKKLNLKPNHIDVYSSESRPQVLAGLVEENGIVFHGSVCAEEVLRIMGESLAVIHTESFDKKIRKQVRYSVSTKIADSLASGTCIFAYGPKEIASISYLENGKAAICCNKPENLEEKLELLLTSDSIRDDLRKNALLLANNHSVNLTPEIIRNEIWK